MQLDGVIFLMIENADFFIEYSNISLGHCAMITHSEAVLSRGRLSVLHRDRQNAQTLRRAKTIIL